MMVLGCSARIMPPLGHANMLIDRFELRKAQWIGKLASFADGIITLEPVSGATVQFPLEQVEKANLKYEW